MTTPTTAEQISGIREEFTREYSDYFGETHEELDADRLVQALLDARATIARLEASNRDLEAAVHTYRTRADAAERRVEAVAKGLKAVETLISASRGVIGLHLNGDEAPWEDLRTGGRFEEWLLDFDTALAAASGAKEGR